MKRLFLTLALFACAVVPAYAHHNWSAIYDTKGDLEIEGEVSRIIWRNPHVIMEFTENKGAANEKVWTTESNSVAALTRMGVTKEMVAAGTKVRVAGYPSKTKDDDFFMNHLLLLSDGQELVFLRTADARWPEESKRIGDANYAHGLNPQEDISERPTSIFAAWSTIFGAEGSHRAIKGPRDVKIDYAEPRGTGGCASKDLWGEMGSPYPIELRKEGDDKVIIHVEQNDTIRTVHMDIPHDDKGTIKNNLGYSTGRYVNDTLMVTTTFAGSNSPVQLHETFSLSKDRNHLNYSMVIVNPESDELPTTNARWWEFQPNSFVQPYDCVDD